MLFSIPLFCFPNECRAFRISSMLTSDLARFAVTHFLNDFALLLILIFCLLLFIYLFIFSFPSVALLQKDLYILQFQQIC